MKNTILLILIFLLILTACTNKSKSNVSRKITPSRTVVKKTEVKVKTDKDWIKEGYIKKKLTVEVKRCVCKTGIHYDTGERCRIHDFNNGECGTLVPYPKGDRRGIGSEFCRKPRAVKGEHSHGHLPWFNKKKYKDIYKWVKG